MSWDMLGSYTETSMLRCVWSLGQLKSSGVVELHAAVQTNKVGPCTFYQLNMEIVECLRIRYANYCKFILESFQILQVFVLPFSSSACKVVVTDSHGTLTIEKAASKDRASTGFNQHWFAIPSSRDRDSLDRESLVGRTD